MDSNSIQEDLKENKLASTNQIWFNADKGKYYLIDGDGKPTLCNNGG